MSDEQKQLEATPQEFERASRRGQRAYSGELAAAIVLSGGLVAALAFGPAVLRAAAELVGAGLSGDAEGATVG